MTSHSVHESLCSYCIWLCCGRNEDNYVPIAMPEECLEATTHWHFKGSSHIGILHPYAQVLAMSAFDSYSQSKRSPRPLSRHRPCKTPFPIGNASFNKPWPNYHGSIMFYSFLIESHRNAGFQRAFFRGHCWRHKQKREAGPFPSLYTAGWVLIKEKNEVQNEVKTRYGKSPASTHMDFGPQAANLPFLGSLVAKQWQFAESQHTAMAV